MWLSKPDLVGQVISQCGHWYLLMCVWMWARSRRFVLKAFEQYWQMWSLPVLVSCLWRWSTSFVLEAKRQPHVGQATALRWVWTWVCSSNLLKALPVNPQSVEGERGYTQLSVQ